MPESTPTRQVLSVSELTLQIKSLLEKQFVFVWVKGEISNFRRPMSGHFYFSLKDDDAQIGAVMFRGQNKNLKFELEDGMAITGLGRLSVYEPRGVYQIVLEYIEPHGTGELQVAFEQLKRRLAEQGFFNDEHKRPIPFLPNRICLITSPTGAVVHDMRQTINRRFPNIPIQIVPVKVQGLQAIDQIVDALETVNQRKDADVIILARGGGSLEDLQAFNSEAVAKAIYASEIPVVSGVGHQTDFTIADFVADVRAATPSVAAELVTPVKTELIKRCADRHRALVKGVAAYLDLQRKALKELARRIIDPRRKLIDMRIHVDESTEQLIKNMRALLQNKRQGSAWRAEKLLLHSPSNQVARMKSSVRALCDNLLNIKAIYLNSKHRELDVMQARLRNLNPRAILARGYSITRLPDGAIVRSEQAVTIGQSLEVLLYQGRLGVTVKTKHPDISEE